MWGRQDDTRSGIRRHINLIAGLPGFRSLAEVRSAFPAGIDPRDAAWMWRRLLVAVGAAHRAGVIGRRPSPTSWPCTSWRGTPRSTATPTAGRRGQA